MKKLLVIALFVLTSAFAKAQDELAFPFQGGSPIMARFFKDSVDVGNEIKQKKATGMAVIKFTADVNGVIQKMVVYYADDYLLTVPIIDALKKSNKKWIIPNKEKFHDFIIPFSIGYNTPATGLAAVQKAAYNFYVQRRPILTSDQLPLNAATLLPIVVVKYDLQ